MKPAILTLAVILAGCAAGPETTLPDLTVAAIIDDELHWRLPNSHATLLDDDAKEMEVRLCRARVLVATEAFARKSTRTDHTKLAKLLRATPKDDFHQKLALARLLAACGCPDWRIFAAWGEGANDDENLRLAVDEGSAIWRQL